MKKESRMPFFEGVESIERWLVTDDNVRLKIFHFSPLRNTGKCPLVIITGLATVIDSFRRIIEGLSQLHPVYYFETRDKSTAKISKKADFGIGRMAKDLAMLVSELKMKDKGYAITGYSMGAAVIAEANRLPGAKPGCIIFMEPTAEFNYPEWSLSLIKWFGLPFYGILKSMAKWYLQKFLINRKEDNQMTVITSDSLDKAEPFKIRNTVLAIAGYKLYDSLSDIRCPALIVGTSKDGLHSPEQMKRMLMMLENAEFIDLQTNERTHNLEMVKAATDFISATL